jgi:hypothetical protein
MKDMIYAESVSPNLFHWVIGVFHSISRIGTFIFFIGFLKGYIRVHSSYFFHRIFGGVLISKIHIFKCTERGGGPFEGTPLRKVTLSRRQLLERT